MIRRILVIEKSALAKNIYSMILSKLYQVDISTWGEGESLPDLKNQIATYDLLLAGQDTISDKKEELFKVLKTSASNERIPVVIFVHQGGSEQWKEFAGLDNVKILERPFFPDDLLMIVDKLWGENE